MKFQAIPPIFYPNAELADFLLANTFREITHESEAAQAMGQRAFRQSVTGLYICLDPRSQGIILENEQGWLFNAYPYLSAAALIYLITESPKKAADQAIFHVLADIKP